VGRWLFILLYTGDGERGKKRIKKVEETMAQPPTCSSILYLLQGEKGEKRRERRRERMEEFLKIPAVERTGGKGKGGGGEKKRGRGPPRMRGRDRLFPM